MNLLKVCSALVAVLFVASQPVDVLAAEAMSAVG